MCVCVCVCVYFYVSLSMVSDMIYLFQSVTAVSGIFVLYSTVVNDGTSKLDLITDLYFYIYLSRGQATWCHVTVIAMT